MCMGQCSYYTVLSLYQLVVISIICNVVLFFPNLSPFYMMNGQITEEVKYMGGLVGGGFVVLIAAIFMNLHVLGKRCCNICGVFWITAVAVVGGAGALYSFIVAWFGLINGPCCIVSDMFTCPFKKNYLWDRKTWDECKEPKSVVEFNIALFVILLVVSSLQFILCISPITIKAFIKFFQICKKLYTRLHTTVHE